MNEETNTLIAKHYLGNTLARDFSDWAVLCLEQNLDTKSIRILASMFDIDSLSEIDEYFKRSLNELGWNHPQENECLERYAKSVAQQILNKKISPVDGCGIIYDIYCLLSYSKLNYPKYLENWHHLYWAYDYLPSEETDPRIIWEAERLISGEKIIFPKNIEEKPLFSKVEKQESFLSKLWQRIF